MIFPVSRQCLLSRALCVRPFALTATRRRCKSHNAHPLPWRTPPSIARTRKNPHAAISAATVIPHSVAQDDTTLLGHIQPVSTPAACEAADQDAFCLVFVTPSFAPKLLDQHFVTQLLGRIHAHRLNKPTSLRIHALCAVVDSLPVGQPLEAAKLGSRSSKRFKSLPHPPVGGEGIAYVSLPSTYSVPSSLPSPAAPGALDFIFSTTTSENQIVPQLLRMPLANTVFRTGTPSTMFHSIYTKSSEESLLRHESRTDLTHHAIYIDQRHTAADIAPETAPSSPDLDAVLSMALLPLTQPRRVNASMGNIVRRIIDSNGDEIPASSELEHLVARFFEARGEPAQATTVWALIIPQTKIFKIENETNKWLSRFAPGLSTAQEAQWEGMWRQDPPQWPTMVRKALDRGGRLHRVLSGGGGWGQKVGLLSLDPVPADRFLLLSDIDDLPTTPEPTDFASTLTPVVQDGDFIQFFIQPASYLAAEVARYDSAEQLGSLLAERVTGWQLGTVPSTVDSIPNSSWQHVSPLSNDASIFIQSFGALAEGPLTLRQFPKYDPIRPTTTIIDAPFSRFHFPMDVAEVRMKGKPKRKESKADENQDGVENRRARRKREANIKKAERKKVAAQSHPGNIGEVHATDTKNAAAVPYSSNAFILTRDATLGANRRHTHPRPASEIHTTTRRLTTSATRPTHRAYHTSTCLLSHLSPSPVPPSGYGPDRIGQPAKKRYAGKKAKKIPNEPLLFRRVVSINVKEPPPSELPSEAEAKNGPNSPLYNSLRSRYRRLHRQLLQLSSQCATIIQSLVARDLNRTPSETTVLLSSPRQKPNFRSLNTRFAGLKRDLEQLEKECKRIISVSRRQNSTSFKPPRNSHPRNTKRPNNTTTPPIRRIQITTYITPHIATRLLALITGTTTRITTSLRSLLLPLYTRHLSSQRAIRHKKRALQQDLPFLWRGRRTTSTKAYNSRQAPSPSSTPTHPLTRTRTRTRHRNRGQSHAYRRRIISLSRRRSHPAHRQPLRQSAIPGSQHSAYDRTHHIHSVSLDVQDANSLLPLREREPASRRRRMSGISAGVSSAVKTARAKGGASTDAAGAGSVSRRVLGSTVLGNGGQGRTGRERNRKKEEWKKKAKKKKELEDLALSWLS